MLTPEDLFEIAIDEVPNPEERIQQVFTWSMEGLRMAIRGCFTLAAIFLAALVPVLLAPPKNGFTAAAFFVVSVVVFSSVLGWMLFRRQKEVAASFIASLRLYRLLLPIALALRPWVR